MKSAILQETLEVWYQPIIHAGTGCFYAAESLVRLPNGDGGFYPAGQVIALAERSGMVEQLGIMCFGERAGICVNTGKNWDFTICALTFLFSSSWWETVRTIC